MSRTRCGRISARAQLELNARNHVRTHCDRDIRCGRALSGRDAAGAALQVDRPLLPADVIQDDALDLYRCEAIERLDACG